MGALVQSRPSRFDPLVVVSRSQPRLATAPAVGLPELRAFPVAPARPSAPLLIRDEILELYAFIFCQGGFRQLGMTFEQFLAVVLAMKPATSMTPEWADENSES